MIASCLPVANPLWFFFSNLNNVMQRSILFFSSIVADGKIRTLHSSCVSCHKETKAKNYYLGEKTDHLLDELKVAIDE
jgi:hypothetical protein